MNDYTTNEERLARLLAMLPPAPEAWVEAAAAGPAFQRAIDQVLSLAEVDATFRAELLDDLDAALERAGVEPNPAVRAAVRSRLTDRP
jgi:hypothetical protein